MHLLPFTGAVFGGPAFGGAEIEHLGFQSVLEDDFERGDTKLPLRQ